ncbi:Uncharacterised protein [Candidatus Anstonella stagnisolia]|nr:Uncharacterised protein [Candidatus Anstonella stagnisolia]
MANINIELTGYIDDVMRSMIARGYAKTKTEAVRLALFQFDQLHSLTDDQLYEKAAEKVLSSISSGKTKMRKFSLSELG